MNSNLCFNSSKEEQYDCHYYSFIIFIRVGSAMFRIPEMVNNSPSVSHIFHQFLQQKLLQFQETPSVLLNMFCFLKLYTFVHDVKKWQFFFLFTRNILLFLSPVYFYLSFKSLFRPCIIWEVLPNSLKLTGTYQLNLSKYPILPFYCIYHIVLTSLLYHCYICKIYSVRN